MKWKTLLSFQDLTEAYVIRSLLESHDLEVRLKDEYSRHMMSYLPLMKDMELQVLDKDFEKASQILENQKQGFEQQDEGVEPSATATPSKQFWRMSIIAFFLLPVIGPIMAVYLYVRAHLRKEEIELDKIIIGLMFTIASLAITYFYLTN